MKLNRIAKNALVILLTIVLFTGYLAPHTVNSETASYGPVSNTEQASNTISSNSIVNSNVLSDFSDLSDPEALAAAENAYRERMQQERAEAILTDSKISNYVNTEEFFETKPMFRLEALEKLNTYVVQNADNTNTVYIMSENVKYIDETGKIREKDINLSATEKGYSVTDSDVKLQFPTNLSNGIFVNTEFGSLSLVPRLRAESTAEFNDKSNYVLYRGALGNGTSLRYTPTLSGVKEDIILEIRPESNSFEFCLETQGFYLNIEDGIYYLVSSDNKDSRIRFSQIFIYDANGRFSSGEMTVVDEGSGTFVLTVTVPREFLESPDTVYPVVVDPEIIKTDVDSSLIIDAPVFEIQSNLNAGTWPYDSIGYTDSTYGLARTVVKLSGLLSNSIYQNLTSDKITSVTFSAREATGNSSKTVKLHPITGSPIWTETTVTWNNYGTADTTANYGGTLTGDQWTHFNITNLVKAWKNGTYNGNGCFIFIMGGTENSQCRALYATEYSGTSSRPYVTLTHQAAVEINPNPIYVNENGMALPVCSVSPAGTYNYSWSVNNNSVATCTNVNYSATMLTGLRAGMTELNVTVKDSSNVTIGSASAMVFVRIPDGIFKIENNSCNKLLTVEKTLSNQQLSAFLYSYSYTGNDLVTDQITQMWRIKHIVYNIYSIRPYYKLDMRFGKGENNKAITSYINSGDTYNSEYSDYMWWITWDSSDNYVIRCDGTTRVLSAGNWQDGIAPVNVQSGNNLGSYAWWYFINVTSAAPTGIYLYDTEGDNIVTDSTVKYIAPEETRTLEDIGIIPVAYSKDVIDQSFVWYSGVIADATVTSTGDVTGIRSTGNGYVGVFVSWNCQAHSNITSSYWLKVLEISNGLFFIENKETEMEIDIAYQNMTNGSNIHQWDFHGNFSQRWIVTRVDNYYTIKSANSQNNYYISSDGSYMGNVQLYYGDETDEIFWSVEKTSNGSYKIVPKLSAQVVVALDPVESFGHGGNVLLYPYSNDYNFEDEWLFINITECDEYDVMFLNISDTNNYIGMGNSLDNLYNYGCERFYYNRTDSITDYSCKSIMEKSKIVVIGAHGNDLPYSTNVQLRANDDGSDASYILDSREDIYDHFSYQGHVDFSNVNLIIYLNCWSGYGSNNLVTASTTNYYNYENEQVYGAQAAIGFKNEIAMDPCSTWLAAFFESYENQNNSLETCIIYACGSLWFPNQNGLGVNSVLLKRRGD